MRNGRSFFAETIIACATLTLLAACTNEQPEQTGKSPIKVPATAPVDSIPGAATRAGVLANKSITEASGLATSKIHPDRLWLINDGGGGATLYAVGLDGSDQGEVGLPGISNVDWEDLSSFEFEGAPKILIADVGDNLGIRSHVNLYVVNEPEHRQKDAELSWHISLRFPGGPRDVESVAVDPIAGVVYLLSKRTIPAELYAVPLRPPVERPDDIITATFLGTIASIPQPTQRDLDRALMELNWHWQPAAMTFSDDGTFAVILTYRAVYLFPRNSGQPWLEALQGTPQVFSLSGIKGAEAVTIAGDNIFVTVESANAPLYRIIHER